MHLLITQVQSEAIGVISLKLSDPNGRKLPVWGPGAHIDLVLPTGLVRQYSLCGDPVDRLNYCIAVLLDPCSRGGSAAVHNRLRVGDRVEVGVPRNQFALTPSARALFIAGGIGITPILPMIRTAKREGRDWQLHYGGQSRRSMAFVDAFQPDGDRVTVYAKNEGGRIPLQTILSRADQSEIYCCGPLRLMDAVKETCIKQGILERLHLESFSPPEAVAATDRNTEFVAVIRSTGLEITVPADKSLLQCLLEANVDVLFSCEEGACGSCETIVLEGEPLHRDSVLARRSDGVTKMRVCVSRSRTRRLVLDL